MVAFPEILTPPLFPLEKKISCRDENGKGFQDWLQGEKVKVHMYVAERFPLEKRRPEVSLLNKCSHFQKG